MRRVLGLLLLLPVLAPAARAAAPDWTGSFGGTFAINARPDGGGFSGSLAALWPIEERFSLGAMLVADDLGMETGPLVDAHTGEPLGRTARFHRAIYGGTWRLDGRLDTRRGWEPFASATWGFYSINDELHGAFLGRVSAAGFSLGGGLRRPLGSRGALGASLRYHRMFDNRIGRYVSAGLDWAWRTGR